MMPDEYYYLYTGDLNFLHGNWVIVKRSFDYLRSLKNFYNLIFTNKSNAVDWYPHSKIKLTGTVKEFNSLYYGALLGGAKLAKAVSDFNAQGDYNEQAIRARAAVNVELCNSDTGLYAISDQIRGPVAQDANTLAVLHGVAPQEKWEQILTKIGSVLTIMNRPLAFSSDYLQLSQLISLFISSFDITARFEAGNIAGTLIYYSALYGDICSQTDCIIVAHSSYVGKRLRLMVLRLPPAAADGTYTSLAHGWSSDPTFALSKYVLGICPSYAWLPILSCRTKTKSDLE